MTCFVPWLYSANNGHDVATGSTSDDVYDFERCAREGFIFYQNEDSREGTLYSCFNNLTTKRIKFLSEVFANVIVSVVF